jgi:hypothetical protein
MLNFFDAFSGKRIENNAEAESGMAFPFPSDTFFVGNG